MSKNSLSGTVFLTLTLIMTPVTAETLPSAETSQTSPSNQPNYGCISGYSNGTFQGNRPVTRYEFAAGLNACLEQLNRQLENNTTNRATKEDLVELTDRINRDRQELQNLSDRLNNLDSGQK